MDVHGVDYKIFSCDRCDYASRWKCKVRVAVIYISCTTVFMEYGENILFKDMVTMEHGCVSVYTPLGLNRYQPTSDCLPFRPVNRDPAVT